MSLSTAAGGGKPAGGAGTHRRWPAGVTAMLPAVVVAVILPLLLVAGLSAAGRVLSADDHLYVHAAWARPDAPPQHNPHLSDPALHFAALRARAVDALAHGHAPLWNPDIFAGAPLLGDAQSAPFAVPTLLRLLLPSALAQNLGVAWVLAWTALGTALLLRRLGAGPWGTATGAAAALTGPFVVVWLLHPHAMVFAWIPWVLWALQARRPVALSLCVAGLLSSGHPGTAVHGLALAMAWWLLACRDLRSVIGLVAGGLLSAPVWLSFAEQLRRSVTLDNRVGSHLEPRQALDLLWPGFLGHPARETWQGPGAWIDGQLHPGLLVFPLALLALGGRTRRGTARLLWAGWLLAVGVSFWGPPVAGNHARLASEAAWLLALAAGLGLSRVEHRRTLGPIALALVLATGLWARRDDQGSIPAEAFDAAPNAWVQDLRTELGCDAADGSTCRRVLGLQHALQPNLGARAGLRDLRGYDLPVSTDTERFMAALDLRLVRPWFPVTTPPIAPLLDLACVGAVVSPTPLSHLRDGLSPWEHDAPSAVYLRPDPGPRAWLATAPHPAWAPGAALHTAALDPEVRSHPPVEGLSGSWPRRGRQIPLLPVEEGPNRVRIAVDPPERALLVLADAWAPGWRVEVDGAPAELLRVAGVFRGVVVVPGVREVLFTYSPAGWRWGLRLAAAGVVVTVLLGWRRRG